MKGFFLSYIGKRRNATAIGFIKLIYNVARYEQIVRLHMLPCEPTENEALTNPNQPINEKNQQS